MPFSERMAMEAAAFFSKAATALRRAEASPIGQWPFVREGP